MKASDADKLKPGNVIYANFGGWPQDCTVISVVKERACRRISVQFRNKRGQVCEERIRHQSVFAVASDLEATP